MNKLEDRSMKIMKSEELEKKKSKGHKQNLKCGTPLNTPTYT